MTYTEIKQRIQAVLNSMDGVAIAGIKNRQIVTGCETILSEILKANFEPDQSEQ